MYESKKESHAGLQAGEPAIASYLHISSTSHLRQHTPPHLGQHAITLLSEYFTQNNIQISVYIKKYLDYN